MIFQGEPSTTSFGETVIARVVRFLNYSFVDQKEFKLSILSLLLLVLVLVITTIISRYTRRFLQTRILPRFHIEVGLQYTLLRLVHYVIIALGLLYAMKIGFSIDLTSVAVIVGFLSVGVGFGLQYLASDIASGFILLFERPVGIGDWVELDGGIEGRVEHISLRSTIIITNENMAVIIPNSKLVQNKFVNYSYGDQLVRLNIPVGVAYASDLDKVSEALLEAARSVEEVLSEPKPVVHFDAFGDSSLNLQIRVWINEPRDHIVISSHVNFAIEQSFRKHNIEIPFPQRDIRVRTGSVEIKSDERAIDRREVKHDEPGR